MRDEMKRQKIELDRQRVREARRREELAAEAAAEEERRKRYEERRRRKEDEKRRYVAVATPSHQPSVHDNQDKYRVGTQFTFYI